LSPARLSLLLLLGSTAFIGLETAATGRPGWVWVIGFLLAIGGLGSLGIYFPWLEMYGRVVCRAPRGTGLMALTFDDGPHPLTTRQVLSVLAPSRHRATFFVLGEKAERHPDVIREIRDAGHTLAIHGYVHDRLHPYRGAKRIAGELIHALDVVEQISGLRPTWFRPPVGQTSPTSVIAVRRAGLKLMGWSGRGYDGVASRSPERVLKSALKVVADGAVLVLHDASEKGDFAPASLPILPQLLAELDARQLTSVGIDELFPEPTSR
jgi:peptidoglycan/xylan/chitin deacetylase (PgdA/CDA1 family)